MGVTASINRPKKRFRAADEREEKRPVVESSLALAAPIGTGAPAVPMFFICTSQISDHLPPLTPLPHYLLFLILILFLSVARCLSCSSFGAPVCLFFSGVHRGGRK